MIKIVTVSVAVALIASAGFAGGVKDTKLKVVKKGPVITVQNKIPPVGFFFFGTAGAAALAAVLNSSGSSTPNTPQS